MSDKFEVPQLGNRPLRSQKDYVRAYMACTRCRNTKAKCEISPDTTSCVKCVRERRECTFAPERSAKRQKITGGHPETTSNQGRDGWRNELSRAAQESPKVQRPARTLIDAVVSSSKDALGILFNAAEQNESDDSDVQVDARTYESPGSALTLGRHQLAAPLPSALSSPSQSIIDIWKRHRFVLQGWFTAVEAITYIDLFFKNLASLSPVSNTFYADHRNHKSLILDEPLLCCTLLMISSRYHILPGPGGQSRADYIHMRLWKHCEHLIQRITFGQEKYSSAKSRTLGSIKALLLMTEWHPRSLHFPPENDGWDSSLAPSVDDHYPDSDRSGATASSMRWREEVFEPAKRSDRMSWMLLGLATTLAHELGVFQELDLEDDLDQQMSPHNRIRTRRLLFLYVNQLSLRLGCTSFLPQSVSMTLTPPASQPYDAATLDRDKLISLWIDITKLRKTSTEMLFASRATTRQLMSSGRYLALLEHFQPLLAQWKGSFDELLLLTLPFASKQMLLIDYGYVRMYIHSIAMQAVVERARNHVSAHAPAPAALPTAHAPATTLDFDFLKNENKQDYKYIGEVIDASRCVLSTAVALGEADLLRYAPVRVFIRVASAAIFLLKAISLGTSKTDLQKSLDVLESCIHALRWQTSDDMHLSSRYGLLLDRHVRRFKRNFRTQNGETIPPTPRSVDCTAASRDVGKASGLVSDPAADAFDLPTDLTLENMDSWIAQPFDPSFAPFGTDLTSSTGLDADSLNFLWNLPT